MKETIPEEFLPLQDATRETHVSRRTDSWLRQELPQSNWFLFFIIMVFLVCMTAVGLVWRASIRRDEVEKAQLLRTAVQFYTLQQQRTILLSDVSSLAGISTASQGSTGAAGKIFAVSGDSDGRAANANPVCFCDPEGRVVRFAFLDERGRYVSLVDGQWSISPSLPPEIEILLTGKTESGGLQRINFSVG